MYSIALQLSELARLQPQTLAVIEQQGDRRYTYRQLDDLSDSIAKDLMAKGIGPGVRTVLMVTPGIDFFALVFALFKVGAVMVIVDPGIGIKRLADCLANAEPEAFIGNSKAHLARRLFAWAKDTVKINIFVGNRYLPNFIHGGQRLVVSKQSASTGKQTVVSTKAEDIAAILFTSGSTGSPKGVIYTHANFNAQILVLRELYDMRPGERSLSTFPLFALFAIVTGMTAIVPDMNFTKPAYVRPKKIFAAIEGYQVTSMFGSPALLHRVGVYGQQRHKTLPNLRRVLSAGAPVSAKIILCFAGMLRNDAQIFTPYGATECLPISSIASDEIIALTYQQTAQGKGICIGRAVNNITVKIMGITEQAILHWQDKMALEANIIGEIIVKGPQVSPAYYARQQQTALAKITDPAGGFYHRTGDAGYLDQDGKLWFCGRLANRLIIDGQTLFTTPCEEIFNTHAKVLRTALVGSSKDGKTEVVICVEMEPAFRHENKKIMTAELLAIGVAFAQTRSIQHILFHPAFPVDIRHNAKIGYPELTAWAARQLV